MKQKTLSVNLKGQKLAFDFVLLKSIMHIITILDNTNNGDVMKKILITGARSGIISEVIDRIKNKYYIYVTVKNDKQLEIVKEKYKNFNNIECLKLDVTDKKIN